MTGIPNIRVNTAVPFPANVQGAGFIQVTKANGIWTLTPNYQLLTDAPVLNPNQYVAIYDVMAGTYSKVPIQGLFGFLPAYVSDVDYFSVPTDNFIVYEMLTATRTCNLLPVTSYPPGHEISIGDESGNASGLVKINIASQSPIGDDSGLSIVTPYSYIKVKAGVSRWLVPQA